MPGSDRENSDFALLRWPLSDALAKVAVMCALRSLITACFGLRLWARSTAIDPDELTTTQRRNRQARKKICKNGVLMNILYMATTIKDWSLPWCEVLEMNAMFRPASTGLGHTLVTRDLTQIQLDSSVRSWTQFGLGIITVRMWVLVMFISIIAITSLGMIHQCIAILFTRFVSRYTLQESRYLVYNF